MSHPDPTTLHALVEKWRERANLELEPLRLKTRDETVALAGVEKGAQAIYKLCADSLAEIEARLRALAGKWHEVYRSSDLQNDYDTAWSRAKESCADALDTVLGNPSGATGKGERK